MADLKHVLALGKKLRSLFDKEWPQEMDVILNVPTHGDIILQFHNVGEYQNGIEMMRLLGIQKWNKSICRPENPFTYLSATYCDGEEAIAIGIYCCGLPPSCRIETKMMKVPKEKTVETDDFIEIPIRKIVCGP